MELFSTSYEVVVTSTVKEGQKVFTFPTKDFAVEAARLASASLRAYLVDKGFDTFREMEMSVPNVVNRNTKNGWKKVDGFARRITLSWGVNSENNRIWTVRKTQ